MWYKEHRNLYFCTEMEGEVGLCQSENQKTSLSHESSRSSSLFASLLSRHRRYNKMVGVSFVELATLLQLRQVPN